MMTTLRYGRNDEKIIIFLGVIIVVLALPGLALSYDDHGQWSALPLDMAGLKNSLSYVRKASPSEGDWPRTISYDHEVFDFKKNVFQREKKTFVMKRKPLRIIPHGVGVSEILWAICPRERIIAFNELLADSKICFISAELKKNVALFQSKQTERIIGYQPDLVFTVFFSDAAFKEKLKQAHIPYIDLGYFGTIESIKKQILLVGEIIGEEGNATELVRVMDWKIRELREKIPPTPKPRRVLFYDSGGYIPGVFSNFNSICGIIGAENVGANQGIKSWARIDYETLLKWDPEIIIVPKSGRLKAQLAGNEVLSHATAIKSHKIYEIPYVYLNAGSQYMILSANLLAGIVYENAF